MLAPVPERSVSGYYIVEDEPGKASSAHFYETVVPLSCTGFIYGLFGISYYPDRGRLVCHRLGFCHNVPRDNGDLHSHRGAGAASGMVRDMPHGDASGKSRQDKEGLRWASIIL